MSAEISRVSSYGSLPAAISAFLASPLHPSIFSERFAEDTAAFIASPILVGSEVADTPILPSLITRM